MSVLIEKKMLLITKNKHDNLQDMNYEDEIIATYIKHTCA